MAADRWFSENRYGISRNHRYPFAVSLRWPFRSPIVVKRLHRFDAEDEWRGEERKWHSKKCWCDRTGQVNA